MASNRPTDDELQEKALYDIIQYLPLDKLDISEFKNINDIVRLAKNKEKLLGKIESKLDEEGKSDKKAIEENLPAIEAILKDRPELGEARISNMSWKDNDGDKKKDHNPKGMQACTFERDDQVYISFRGTPARSWIDNAKAFVEDLYTAVGISRTEIKVDTELKRYTSPMQEEALDYMESLKKSGVFEKYDNVYVTGHSKGGNEATLVTMVYSDVIDRCISGDGQGFSPEFVRYMKKTLGPEKFAEIQDKMYGFHAINDYVNVLGVSVIKDENKIYFIPEIKLESIIDLLWNHLPTAMVNVKTGKIAQVSEQGALGKFVAKVSEKLMKLNQKDREDAAITGMSPLQYLYAHEPVTSVNPNFLINWCETFMDKADVVESFGNGITILGNIIGETLTEKEGEDLVRYIVDEFGDKNIWIKDVGKAYDSLDYGDKAPELIEKFISDIEEELQGWEKDYLNKYLKDYAENINIYMHMRCEMVGDDKYKSYLRPWNCSSKLCQNKRTCEYT